VYQNEFKALEGRFARPDALRPEIGLVDVDTLIGPITPGSVIAVGSESGGLRTAMLTGVALTNAQAGRRTHLVTTELARDEIARRLMALHSGVSLDALRTGRLYEHDWSALGRIMSIDLPLTLTATTTRVEPVRMVRSLRCKGLDVLVLDLGDWPTSSSRPRAIRRRVSRLLEAARRASCTVLIGCPLEHVIALPATAHIDVSLAKTTEGSARSSVQPVDITVTMNRCGGRGTARTMLRSNVMQLVNGASQSASEDVTEPDSAHNDATVLVGWR